MQIFELLGKGKANAENQKLISTFEEGIRLYKAQDWDAAVAQFGSVKDSLKPNDFASTMYIERCQTMREHPPSEDWDGVYTMTTK